MCEGVNCYVAEADGVRYLEGENTMGCSCSTRSDGIGGCP